MLFRHGPNATWSVLEYLAYPLFMLAATPILVASLGEGDFGLWMLILAIGGFGSVANLGMGAAIVKFVAEARAAGRAEDVLDVVRQSVTISGASALLLCLLMVAIAPLLAQSVFSKMGDVHRVASALRIGALIIFIQQFDQVAAATLKGFERFSVAARVEVAAKFALVGVNVAVAHLTGELFSVLAGTVTVMIVSLAARAWVAGRLVGGVLLMPAWPGPKGGALLRFGGWVWLQAVASVLLSSVDRFVVGGLLGASALAHYSVCTQLAQQVHAVPAAAMGFLMPLATRKHHQGDDVRRVRRLALTANVLVALPLALALAVGADFGLRIWMGPDFAAENAGLLRWLTLAYLLLALNVAAHYLLLGEGEARFVSLTNIVGGILSSVGAGLLVPGFGVAGAAAGRLMYGPVLLLNFVRLFGKRKEPS